MFNLKNDFNEGTKEYFKNLTYYKSLSKIEERRLVKKARKGDIISRNKLIESNLKFVVYIAKKYKGRGIEMSDLISEGNMGLIKAIDRFDLKKDTRLITYAIWYIKLAIREVIRKQLITDEIPNDEGNNFEYQDDDTIEDIEKNNNICVQENNDKNEIVTTLLNTLTHREKEIIKSYFGIDDGKEKKLNEIGQVLELTNERVRQIKEKALIKLRSRILMIEE